MTTTSRMEPPLRVQQPQYSAMTGLMYVFNVIVGTGALAIPGVFAKSGVLLSSLVLVAFAFVSYVTVTWMVEVMSISNALKKRREGRNVVNGNVYDSSSDEGGDEDDGLLGGTTSSEEISSLLHAYDFDITERIEMGTSGSQFYPRLKVFFYACLIIYLYGDLSIYITVVSKSLRDVVCTNGTDFAPCFANSAEAANFGQGMDRTGAYRLFTVLFTACIGPLAYFNVSKTKYIQMSTSLARWGAFTLMIVLSIITISSKGPNHPHPPLADFSDLPSLFGVSIYSFMCHHSLPSLITPIRRKSQLPMLFLLDYLLITAFYLLLSVTASYAFSSIPDLYTLTFISPDRPFISLFLGLFPVFTLSSSFPIIAITLKNNLRAIFVPSSAPNTPASNLLFTTVTIIPPFLVSVFISDVQLLVGFTGAFAGAQIQYVIPALLVVAARRSISHAHASPHASPFQSYLWIAFVLLWTATSTVLVLFHLIK